MSLSQTDSTSTSISSPEPRRRQICKKSTATLTHPNNQSLIGIRRLQSEQSSSSSSFSSNTRVRKSQPTRLQPRDPSEQERTQLKRQNFNHEPARPIQCGLGIGKGGIKRMTAIMRRRDQDNMRELRSVRFLQDNEHSIQLRPFCRLVKELFEEAKPQDVDMRIQAAALDALRASSEAYIVEVFSTCTLLTAHAGRVTLMPKDMDLARRLYKEKVIK